MDSVTSLARDTKQTNAAVHSDVSNLMHKARDAMERFDNQNQETVDMAVRALAWAVYNPVHARLLAEMAVKDTGLGNVKSKIVKNQRKTFGTLRDLLRARSVGVIEDCAAKGLVKYGKPVGVVAAVCPSTNPSATPVNKAMMAVKGGNAVIIAPSPAGYRTSAKTVDLMREELKRCGLPCDLVQVLTSPVTKEVTEKLVYAADLAVVTGSQNNVKRAMQSGTVTIGVGAGNVAVIIDSSADLTDAAKKISLSKCFDNSTSCSSENSVIILNDIYDKALDELQHAGGWLCTSSEKDNIRSTLWNDGVLNRSVIAKGADVATRIFKLPEEASTRKFFMVEEKHIDGRGGFADEKLSLVLTIYRASDFNQAVEISKKLLLVKGLGHSVGIHTNNMAHARELAETSDVVRVLVNQAHTFGNGGSFENCLPFTLSMGGGTWAGNSISENLNYRHFINITHLVTPIAADMPTEEELFEPLWEQLGHNNQEEVQYG